MPFISCLLLLIIGFEFASYRAFFTARRLCCLLPGPLPHTTFHPVPFRSFQPASCLVLQWRHYNLEVSFFFSCSCLNYAVNFWLYPLLPVVSIPNGLPFMKGLSC